MRATRTETLRRPPTRGRNPPAAQPARRDRWLLVSALVLVVVPFAVVAVRSLAANRHLLFAGDQALIGLDADDASRLDQLVGPYSRYLWSHPGPAWFYLLTPVHWLAGSTSAGLVAAAAAVNAAFAGLLVAVLHRRRSPLLTLAVAVLVLGFVLRMPAEFFVDVWNPFALLLPTALLVALAAETAARASLCHLLATAGVGSFLVQTHVGTLPLVGLVTLSAALGVALPAVRGAAPGAAPGARSRRQERRRIAHPRRAALLGGVLALMWLPPAVQQLTAAPGKGNVGLLVTFFRHPPGDAMGHPLREAVTAVGRVLAMAPYGRGPGAMEMDLSVLPRSVAVALLAQVVGALVLVVAGRRLGTARALWTGVLVLVSLAAAVVAAHSATGPLYWYLVVWVSVLPLASAIGYADLAAGLLAARRSSRPAREPARGSPRSARTAPVRLLAAGVAGSVLALVAGTSLSLARATTALPDSAGVHAALPLVTRALDGPDPAPTVTLELDGNELWPIVAGLAYDLTEQGYRVLVHPAIGALFGADRVVDRPVGTVFVLAAAGTAGTAGTAQPDGRLLGTFDTEITRASLFVARAGP